MNLAEEVIVAGLTGRLGPTFPGERFVFVAYNSLLKSGVDVLAEGPTPFLALLRGVRRDCSADRDHPAYYALQVSQDGSPDPARWAFFDTLPEEIRNSGNRDLIGFLLYVSEDQAFEFSTVSCYLSDDTLEEVLPGARCLLAWDAEPPRQEEGFGVFALAEEASGDEPWIPKPRRRTGDEATLFRAILDEPEDDTVRLAYADWLEENGEPERAEFIRVQIALAGELTPERRKALARRKEELLLEHGLPWRGELPELEGVYWGAWDRGFVGAVSVAQVKGFAEQAEALFAAAPVRTLSLYDHRAAESLEEMLGRPELQRVTAVDFSGCPLTPESAQALARCAHLGGLKTLNLKSCRLGRAGAEFLTQAIALRGVRTLNLADNDLDGAAMRALAQSAVLESVECLTLDGNPLGREGAEALARSPPLSRLRELRLAHTAIGPEGARALAAAPGLPELTLLWLLGCQVGDAGAQAFAESPHLRKLARLNLCNNAVTTAGARALAGSTQLPALADLALYDTPSRIDREAAAALRARFAKVSLYDR